MNDNFVKVVLMGILICLAVIAFKPTEKYIQSPTPNVSVDSKNRFIQIAPNTIGVVDTGHNTGKEQLVVFEYDSENQAFKVVSSLDYQEIFTHPEEHGIPIRK
ncbi:hypothetical protein [Paenibacillus prosopidis]|uniref:YmzC-like protein n=1 Tax=Paenibacillus prosopidis TaxID=630520 RepID=A0A368VCJ5_9BACL|nr:hypothetical protein [Paenibacillus prosopidis]RCW38846.1 hypothetical protein DFP97_1772 [Paenibacillus prosopidis]